MICPECGSYQPDRAKYCGICGSALSQDGLVESFLKKEGDAEIVLPRHRSPWFYMAITMIVILALALLTGAGYLVYRAAWGEKKGEGGEAAVEDNTLEYVNTDIGFSLSYPDNWTLEEGYPQEGQLMALKLLFSSQKNLELSAYQLDPVVTIGGIEGIEEYLIEDAEKRIAALGGMAAGTLNTGDAATQPGYTQGESTQNNPLDQQAAGAENGSLQDILTSTKVGDLPAFYTEFNANIMGEETRFMLYYIVADDYLFVFFGRAPAGEYRDVRPLFVAIAGSFKWERTEEAPPAGIPPISAR